jgi:glycosyltransferase involved in cell wall biosynthesis
VGSPEQFVPGICHLNHATGSADGGIAAAVADLIEAQRHQGLVPQWCTGDRHRSWRRDRHLLQEVLSLAPAVAHIHGLWRAPTRIVPGLAAAAVPVVIAPHGMLDPWAMANSRWKKQLVWRLWEHHAVAAAGCLQALCPAEADAIRALGFDGPIALIPNGVRAPEPGRRNGAPPWASCIAAGEKVLLFLGRFHAKKGLKPLLEAWSLVAKAAAAEGWWLVLVGYGDGGALRSRAEREGLERLLVLGPCFGAEQQACYNGADAFVLPSFSEGLPMAALEAMSWSLPCLLSPACNLPEAFTTGAALPVLPVASELVGSLHALLTMPKEERTQMGAAGSRLVQQHYSWPQAAEATMAVYRWLLGEGPRPVSLL